MNTTAMAAWLSRNIPAIACDEASGELFRDVQNAVEAIERMINRPVEPIECGPCPTIDENENRCSVGLTAKQGSVEVTCWKCKITYNIDRLIQQRLGEVPYRLFTARDVLTVMARIGDPIPQSTWRRWRAEGKVEPAGELYGEPGYRLDDVKDQLKRYTRKRAS